MRRLFNPNPSEDWKQSADFGRLSAASALTSCLGPDEQSAALTFPPGLGGLLFFCFFFPRLCETCVSCCSWRAAKPPNPNTPHPQISCSRPLPSWNAQRKFPGPVHPRPCPHPVQPPSPPPRPPPPPLPRAQRGREVKGSLSAAGRQAGRQPPPAPPAPGALQREQDVIQGRGGSVEPGQTDKKQPAKHPHRQEPRGQS